MKLKSMALALGMIGFAAPGFATTGMNLEGYGAISTGMGGAAMAFDVGASGMINNPATIGFLKSGGSRLDVGLGALSPSMSSSGTDAASNTFYMPAFGYIRKDGNIAWGIGMAAQGGMGAEYSSPAAMYGTLNSTNLVAPIAFGPTVAPTALRQKSEVGVLRVMLPISYQASDALNIGGSIDYVSAGMDIQWLLDGPHFGDLMPGAGNTFGRASNSIATTFGGALAPGDQIHYGYFNFNTDSQFSQRAKGDGWAANLGFTYKVSPALTVGGVYHAKTSLGDMKTGSSDASITFDATVAGFGGAVNFPVVGQIVIKNFQWPETIGLGFSYQYNDKWQFVGDYKRINWSGVMKSFNMSFIAAPAASQPNPLATGLVAGGGTQLDVEYFQNWKDQDVVMLGAAYRLSDQTTLRFGGSFSSNPVPNQFVTPLFPATTKNHFMFGFGHAFDKSNALDFSLSYAPKVTVTNNWSAAGGTNQTIGHSQLNWQLTYGHQF